MTTDACREVIHAKNKRSTETQVCSGTEQPGDCTGMLDGTDHRQGIPGKSQQRRDSRGPLNLDDDKLEQMLFVSSCPGKTRPLPNWDQVQNELKRKGVTLALLWQEYKAVHPDGYQYSQFCELYRTWLGSVDPVMRQKHKAGEKLFVDYAGQTIPVVDSQSGQIREAQLFLAVLGASSYIYAEATWTQSLPDWIGSHVRALEYLGGVPEVIVPDNLKSGVTSPMPLRTRTQSDLPGVCSPLLGIRCSCQSEKTSGQSQG